MAMKSILARLGGLQRVLEIGYTVKFVPILLITVLASLALWRLDALPPLWWDEGWTLCVARHWVERGHYGCLLAGEPAPPSLAAAFPVVAPVAFSFRLLGVGIWQARTVGLLFTAGALALLYHLAYRLYNRKVAISALVILLLMPTKWLHPVFVGKQVLGEMPALFYLLAGYTCFLLTQRAPLFFMPLALGFWGVALRAKVQVLPFWAASLVVPLVVASMKRHWRSVGLLAVGLFGSLGVYQLLLWGQQLLLKGHVLPRASVSGLYNVLALVADYSARLSALRFALVNSLPVLLGLGYAVWRWGRSYRESDLGDTAEVVRLMLLALVGSWFTWFVLLSIGWDRYLFPFVFIGSPFAAALLHDVTDGFDVVSTIKGAVSALKKRRFQKRGVQAVGAVFLTAIMCLTAARAVRFFCYYFSEGDASVLPVTHFLNTTAPSDALIETYDSELFFLLDRPYHYPPAQTHVELIRQEYLDPDVSIKYDPLAADPDYLVIGPFSRWVRLYDPVLASGAFRPLRTEGSYEIYERVR